MSKTVKGFDVRGQTRRSIRGDLSGNYEGVSWYVRSEANGLFYWTIGKMSGYDGPTLSDVLRTMKRAARVQKRIEEDHGELTPERLRLVDFLLKWERRALQGRLEITGPHGGDKGYFKVMVKDLA